MSVIATEMPHSVANIALRGMSRRHLVNTSSIIFRDANKFGSNICLKNAPRYQNSRFINMGVVLNERARVSAVPLRATKKSKSYDDKPDKRGSQFIDSITVTVKAGNGGDGLINLASKFQNEFAGPDGGNGGNGGHILFEASKEMNSLNHLKKEENGHNGTAGRNLEKEGKCGDHRVIKVPIGTIFRNIETREILTELTTEGSFFLAAKGGAGGRGNACFKSSETQAPKLAEAGGEGEKYTFDIELRTMAHVGLIGFPNAGKSTLLRAISRARPKVAAYPFTTLTPHLGMVPYDDYVQIAVADIPGIIPDAHKNKGLGISFLRHIERCLCLLYVVDMSNDDAFSNLQALKYELDQYKPGLSKRVSGVVANKMDMPSSHENLPSFIKAMNSDDGGDNQNVFPVSGKMGTNIQPLLVFIRKIYDESEETISNRNSCHIDQTIN